LNAVFLLLNWGDKAYGATNPVMLLGFIETLIEQCLFDKERA
jgi:hypothetical protein